jgi:transcriptional regulator with XRE-family HTH domain
MGRMSTVADEPQAGGQGNGRSPGNGRARRTELAEFLRSRRERIRPEDVGLPPGLRRRTAGLRREEVAQLAGVGVTWYTWLEQGRQINASIQVLDAVARTLRLDPAERDHLYRLADVPAAAAIADGAALLSPDVQVILDSLVPLPSSVVNERFDLLAWNAAYAAMWPGLVGAPPAERNTLWQSFTHPACCQTYVNREDQLPRMVAQLRGSYGRHVGEPAWTRFIRRLQSASPEFARIWDAHEVASPATYLKIFRHPLYDCIAMTSTSLAVLATPGARIVVYTPADEASHSAIDRLLTGDGAGAHFPCWPHHQAARALAAADSR